MEQNGGKFVFKNRISLPCDLQTKITISPFSGFRYRLKGILNEKAHNLSKQRPSATSDELKKKVSERMHKN